MNRGLTRTLSWFAPYPVVFDRGTGAIVQRCRRKRVHRPVQQWAEPDARPRLPPIIEALTEAISAGPPGPEHRRPRSSWRNCCARGSPEPSRSGSPTPAPRRRCSGSSWRAPSRSGTIDRSRREMATTVHSTTSRSGSSGQGEMPGRVALARFGELDELRGCARPQPGQDRSDRRRAGPVHRAS